MNFLEGSALAKIKALAINDGNYPKAVKILKECFGDPDLILAAYAEKLRELPTAYGSRHSIFTFIDNLQI
ncbi:MAG: DUF1759 domain-containing protein [Gammaproteobacteria bacterium]|nr:DUF1759 domain-containing protein [Gammaproteobacteria bacterium]